MRVRSVGVVALFALVVASCGGATPEAAGPSEGIQVHGDWVIEVYNEDGTLDESVEFENALSVFGARQLARLVSGNASEGDWQIRLAAGTDQPKPCPSNTAHQEACTIGPILGAWIVDTDYFTLTGSTKAESDAVIASVETRVGLCTPDIAPNDCPAGTSPTTFTWKTLDLADRVAVSAGQTVDVTVEISFTSG